ncbi:MAG: hypothetical protein AMXMBFR84_38270 [Candidatus Hydrogenedentota bacterium]
MTQALIHRFVQGGRRFAIDPETCFCFECDDISWDVLEYYPHTPLNRIVRELAGKHDTTELEEVIGELEWLRSTRAILPPAKKEDLQKEFELEKGLKKLSVRLPGVETVEDPPAKKKGWFGAKTSEAPFQARTLGRDAIDLLLGRAADQKLLQLEWIAEGQLQSPDLIISLSRQAIRAAGLAGKTATVSIRVLNLSLAKSGDALEGHTISIVLEVKQTESQLDAFESFAQPGPWTLAKLAKAVQPGGEGVTGRIVLQPGHPNFAGVVETLDKAGFTHIELDLDGSYAADPSLDPEAMRKALSESAVYYANRLLKHHYFRVDPIAGFFYRIYDGVPLKRNDPSGTNELAVDADGALYPSWRFLGQEAFKVGSLAEGRLDEEARSRFDEIGSVTTGVCRRCWARHVCGGGTAAVHQALSGSFRLPHETWCNAQRAWAESAVSAFNLLSAEGVNFTRMYHLFTRTEKPSLFTLVRAAFRMSVGMRPIEEADADMLMEWENWNSAAYFLYTERGIMITTRYDREMDALHPHGMDKEMILVKRDGKPFGLIKMRPERFHGAAQGWIYMRDDQDYLAEDVRRGFRTLLNEAAKQQAVRRLTIPASAPEKGLQSFLEGLGFKREGTLREALFVHDEYQDVHVYGISVDDL